MADEEQKIVVNGVHTYSKTGYIPPKEKEVQEHLEWFRDQKFALMMHFGVYCQLGMVASWALSDEDQEWSRRNVNWTTDAKEFRKQYFDLNKSFNPIRFNADEWAEMAKQSGFRYLLFTTKHHDGFSMWDTDCTDYKVTAPDCPYHTAKHPDIVGEVFRAFREKGLGIGAYFSKPDWHNQDYWNTELQGDRPTTRNVSYDPAEHPEMWERYREFCRKQILELCTRYGKIDILWLDGGWVCYKTGQEIRVGEIVDECRKVQPWLISADRTVGGPYENYITPEMQIPEEPLEEPWESCLTLGTDFDYRFGDHYKSPREIINLLVNVVAKGGNLAPNVSPQPDGRIPVEAIPSLQGIGQWLKTYGEAIYGTRVCAPYQSHNVAFTQKNGVVYALRMYERLTEAVEAELFIPYTGRVSKVSFLDSGEAVDFRACDGGIMVTIPIERRYGTVPIAMVFRIEK